MNDPEQIPKHGTAESSVAGDSDWSPIAFQAPTELEKTERLAERMGRAIIRSLASDDKTQAELRQVVAALIDLQDKVTEWSRLHGLLHEVLATFSLFHVQLGLATRGKQDVVERQMLLKSWYLCQGRLDALAGFAEDIEAIGRPFCRQGRQLQGERWVVELVALQFLFEDALKEEAFDAAALLDPAEEYRAACHHHLTMANRQLQTAIGRFSRLTTCLLGGIE